MRVVHRERKEKNVTEQGWGLVRGNSNNKNNNK